MILHYCFNLYFTYLLIEEWTTFHMFIGCYLFFHECSFHISTCLYSELFTLFLIDLWDSLYTWILIFSMLFQIFSPVCCLVLYCVKKNFEYILIIKLVTSLLCSRFFFCLTKQESFGTQIYKNKYFVHIIFHLAHSYLEHIFMSGRTGVQVFFSQRDSSFIYTRYIHLVSAMWWGLC